ncbi:MAG: hypothetical protein ACREM2_08150, partial [Vulcanimicrobiaceae bacterium]
MVYKDTKYFAYVNRHFFATNEVVKLARFRGYFPLGGEGSTNGQKTSPFLPAGVPAKGRRAGASRS